jgi:hypothetical protein
MVSRQPKFPHELLHISIAEDIAEIPADGAENDRGFEVTPREPWEIAHDRSPAVSGRRRLGSLYQMTGSSCNRTRNVRRKPLMFAGPEAAACRLLRVGGSEHRSKSWPNTGTQPMAELISESQKFFSSAADTWPDFVLG